MTYKDYQALAVRTSGARDHKFTPTPFLPLPVPKGPVVVRLNTAVLGLVGEVGEFADLLKKVVGHGHPPDPTKFKKEGGDVYWYVAETADALGVPLTEDDPDTVQAEIAESEVGALLPEENPYEEAIKYVLQAASFASRVGDIYLAVMDRVDNPDAIDPTDVPFLLSGIVNNMSVALHLVGLKMSDVLEANIAKLKERYPDGFSEERSLNRTA